MSTGETPFRWRSVAVVVFLPSIVFSTGSLALVPVIPALARDLGTDLGGAAFIAALLVVGNLAGDIPSGAIVARLGERTSMIAASVLSLVGVLLALIAWHPAMLAVGILLVGVATAAFGLARHAFMTSFVPLQYRARALSTLGGSHRLGAVAGPFAGAALLALTGNPESVLIFHAGCAVGAIVILLLFRDPEAGEPVARAGGREVHTEAVSLWATLAASRAVLVRIGIGSAILAGLRQVRSVVLPVWAASIGLDDTTTSVVIGLAGAVDFSLFFLGGWIMDRFGRLWVLLPCVFGLGAGFLALSLTHDLDDRFGWFVGLALVIAVANGIGSGVLMTLGADLADPRNPAPFLGAWRFTNDTGGALLPLAVTAITAAASLSVAVGAVGVLGIVGGIVLRVFVPRYVSSRPGQARPGQAQD